MMGAMEFQAGALDKRYIGVVIGIVTANEDPKNQGRVKLKLPWYDNQTETEWCRVAYACAGPNHGFFAVPEKKAEVLVAFEQGDMRRPFVIGGLFNGKDAPPTNRKSDDERDEKLFRTRGGHALLFRDTKNQTTVKLTTSGGHRLELDDAGRTVTLTTKGGHKAVLDDGGNTISITTSGGQKVVLDGSGSATVTANSVKLDAKSVELGSSASEPLVLGNAFMTLFNAHVHTPGTPTTSPPVTPMTPLALSQVAKTG